MENSVEVRAKMYTGSPHYKECVEVRVTCERLEEKKTEGRAKENGQKKQKEKEEKLACLEARKERMVNTVSIYSGLTSL